MLAAIDFDDDAFGVADKVSDISIDANLSSEMSA
jgi:hypothetical protein